MAATDTVPLSTAPEPSVSASVTTSEEGTVLPNASRRVTSTAGTSATPATPLAGCRVKARAAAAAGATLNAPLVAAVRLPDVASRV